MEGGVEDEDLRQVGQHLLYGHIALEVGIAVERRQVHILLPLFKHGVGDHLAAGEASASHDAVAGSRNLVEALDGAIFGMEQRVEHQFDTLGMRGAFLLDNLGFAIDFGLEEGALEADFLNAAGSKHALAVHFVEFVFDRTAAAVDDKDFHGFTGEGYKAWGRGSA